MRAFFVGGPTDNSELDLETEIAPAHYPPDTGSGVYRYRLQRAVQRNGRVQYVVYAPPDMDVAEVERTVVERKYSARFAP